MITMVRDSDKATAFGKIEIGTLFLDIEDDETLYQKTIPLLDENYPNDPDLLNAVVILGDETGNVIHFEDCDKVIPINNGKFIIET